MSQLRRIGPSVPQGQPLWGLHKAASSVICCHTAAIKATTPEILDDELQVLSVETFAIPHASAIPLLLNEAQKMQDCAERLDTCRMTPQKML